MKRIIFSLSFILCQWLACAAQQSDYKMAGPYEVVARDGQYRSSKGGSERDMKMAWDCARKGQHEKALEIINAYADKLQRLDGHDAPLCLIQGYWLCRAMMIEKSLTPNPSPKERGTNVHPSLLTCGQGCSRSLLVSGFKFDLRSRLLTQPSG